MEIATYILFVLGCLGAADILLYHSVSHGILTHHDSRFELMVHSLRGPTYTALFLLVPNFAMHGAFFWMLIGIFVFDVGISLGDFIIERASREFFGGLPTGEYVLHIILAMLFGGLVTSVCFAAGHWTSLPTGLFYQPAQVPAAFRALMVLMAVLVFLSGTADAIAAARLTKEDKTRGEMAHGEREQLTHGH